MSQALPVLQAAHPTYGQRTICGRHRSRFDRRGGLMEISRRERIVMQRLIRRLAERRDCLGSERAGRLLPVFLPIIVIIGAFVRRDTLLAVAPFEIGTGPF